LEEDAHWDKAVELCNHAEIFVRRHDCSLWSW
jgi:hypothetical protein